MATNYGVRAAHSDAGSVQLYSGRCILLGVVVTAQSGATGHIELYDLAAAPTTEDPVVEFDVTAAGTYSITISNGGMTFANGVYAVVPTSAATTIFYEEQ